MLNRQMLEVAGKDSEEKNGIHPKIVTAMLITGGATILISLSHILNHVDDIQCTLHTFNLLQNSL